MIIRSLVTARFPEQGDTIMHRSPRPLYVLCLLCLTVGASPAAPTWNSLDGSADVQPRLTLLAAGPARIVLEYSLPGYASDLLDIDGRSYSSLTLPGNAHLLRKGLPQAPVLSQAVIVPDRGQVSVRVVDSVVREVSLPPIAPSKGDLTRNIDPESVPYEFAAVYQQGGVFPAASVEAGSPFILRDWRGMSVHVYPCRYDFDRGLLLVLERLTLEITTTGDEGPNCKTRLAPPVIDPVMDSVYRRVFLNYASLRSDVAPLPGRMLMVANDAFTERLAPLARWKRQCGIPVEILTTSAVGGTELGIQAAIRERYEAAEGLMYVVLAGDIEQVPTNVGTFESASSDPMYAMVEGDDSYPDLLVSRLSAQNADHIETQVAKCIRYERDPDLGLAAAWYHKAAGIASDEDDGTGLFDYERANLLRQQLLEYTFTDVARIYQSSGATTADITATLQSGVSLINYLGHGSGSGWVNVFYSNVEVHELDIAGRWPWIVDVACLNGRFSWDECFAEAWLRAGTPAAPRGGIGMFAASTNASWEPPCIMQAEVIDQLCTEATDVLGALCFAGTIEALNQYPPPNPEGVKLAEQYNLFGDCSLRVRTAKPAVLSVGHAQFLPLRSDSFTVDVFGVEGATATLCRGDTLYARAVTDQAGHAVLPLAYSLEATGDLVLTVTAVNHRPYTASVHAVPESHVTIVPNPITVGQPTTMTVTLTDTLGAGLADVMLEVCGFGGVASYGPTGPDGVVHFTWTPLYGETLRVRGRQVGQPYDLFDEPLEVTGAPPLPGAAIAAADTGIALTGALALGFEGTITARADGAGLALRLTGCGVDTTAATTGSELVLSAIPAETGLLAATLGCVGYQVFLVSIPVIEAVARLSGQVTKNGSPLGRALLEGYDGAGRLIFETHTGGTGTFVLNDEIPVTAYTLVIDHYGCAHYENALELVYGENFLAIELEPAATGVLCGTVTAAATGQPLAATIEFYRGDNLSLCAQTTSDPGDGAYTSPPLTQFNYNVKIRSWGCAPSFCELRLAKPKQIQDFALATARAEVLVVDDASKVGPDAVRPTSALVNDLEDLGFMVTSEDIGVTDPLTWHDSELVVLNGGDNCNTWLIYDAPLRQAIAAYVATGGHILVEGGDFAFRMKAIGAEDFLRTVVHVEGCNQVESGSASVVAPDHYLVSHPNVINGAITISFVHMGDKDAVVPLPDATMVGSWTTDIERASIVAFDPDSAPEGGQSVLLAFDYADAEAVKRRQLLENAVLWLLNSEVGTGSISGVARLRDQDDHSGIQVLAEPAGWGMTTAADGVFSFERLFRGTWRITVRRQGWTSDTVEIELAEGEQVEGLECVLDRASMVEICSQNPIDIPDGLTAGITSLLGIGERGRVVEAEVYLRLQHPMIDQLQVFLLSPTTTRVDLLNRRPGLGTLIDGWFPVSIPADQSLWTLAGEPIQGTWTLRAIDWVPWHLGAIEEWCLRLYYEPEIVGVGAGPLTAVATTGGVTLTWQYDPNALDGCHLDRRDAEAAPVRLTTEPLSSSSGQLTFVDAGEGLAPGAELAYSYVAVRDGQEVGRGQEVRVTFVGRPLVFALHPGYPNPFNPITHIRFELPRSDRVTLRIYDLSGRLVRTLVDGRLPAAAHDAVWDGRDDSGRPVASGVYTSRLATTAKAVTRKLVLIQ
jgi:subtilisin-like proprotein convertase family protein/type IV secretory pathway protease TraF